jgi:two-component system phosphate regulon sensor histidine kinase PhoR
VLAATPCPAIVNPIPTPSISEVKCFGIGLDYVKEVCKAHKWKIKIHNRYPLDGTEINLLIPLKS